MLFAMILSTLTLLPAQLPAAQPAQTAPAQLTPQQPAPAPAAQLQPQPTNPPTNQPADPPDELAERHTLDLRIDAARDELMQLQSNPDLAPDWAKRWAGEYYVGDGLGQNVTVLIAPVAGVVCTWHGCLGLYGYAYGQITQVLPDGLQFKLARRSGDQMAWLTERLYFIPWGERRYILPDSEMEALCDQFNQGGFGRASPFLPALRVEDRNLPLGPAPQLPAAFARRLYIQPVDLRIVRLEEHKREPYLPDPRQEVVALAIGVDCLSPDSLAQYDPIQIPLAAAGSSAFLYKADESDSLGLQWHIIACILVTPGEPVDCLRLGQHLTALSLPPPDWKPDPALDAEPAALNPKPPGEHPK